MAKSVNYDRVAPTYDRRYAENRYPGIERMLDEFVSPGQSVLEVGCGTAHWMARLRSRGSKVVGLDRSRGMLRRAADRLGTGVLALGRAEALPFHDLSFDRVVVINALHHFDDPARFVGQARRALRRGGRIVIVGLDPSQGVAEWFVYRYFPRTRELDAARYPGTGQIRAWLEDAGFRECSVETAQRIETSLSALDALDRGMLSKESTSGLALLDDDEYALGIARIQAAAEDARAAGADLRLLTDLCLYATFGTAG